MEPGDRLADRYELISRIGHGGMGEVWRAVQVALDRTVAIKVIHPVADADRAELILQRFQREAELVGRVDHRHVIDVIDYGTTKSGDPFLVMPFLVGETLEQRLRRSPPTTLGEVIGVMRSILGGLAAIHDAGIVHRDLKPANVFLAQDSDGVVPKLLDFGISREGDAAESGLTQENTMIGTPAYMAPEQFESARTVDHRADIFGVGAMLYEALGGRTPFGSDGGGDAFKVYRSVIETEPTPLAELRPELPPALADFVHRAIAKDPEARWRSARAMRKALDELAQTPELAALGLQLSASDTPSPGVDISGQPTAWQPQGHSPSTPRISANVSSKPEKRNSAPWLAIGLLGTVVTGAVAFAVLDPLGPEPTIAEGPAAPPSSVLNEPVQTVPSDPLTDLQGVGTRAESRWQVLGSATQLETLAVQWARLAPADQGRGVRFFRVGDRWVAASRDLGDETRAQLEEALGVTDEGPAPPEDALGLEPALVRSTARLSLHESPDIESPNNRVLPHDTLAVALLGEVHGAESALADEGRQLVFLVAATRVSGWSVARFASRHVGCLPLPGALIRESTLDARDLRRTVMVSRTDVSMDERRRTVIMMAATSGGRSVVAMFDEGERCDDVGPLVRLHRLAGQVAEYFLTETAPRGETALVASWSRGAPRADGNLQWAAFIGERQIWREQLPSADFVDRGRASVSGRRDRALRTDDTHALVVSRRGAGRIAYTFDGTTLVPDP